MLSKNFRLMTTAFVLASLLLLASCSKKVAEVKTPEPPAAAPTVSLSADPTSIQQGQSTTLSWQTTNANEISIEGLGTVPATGSRTVSPTITTNYSLTAKGPGGTGSANASVTVLAPKAETVAPPPPRQPSDEELFREAVKDVFFDYDKSVIRETEKSSAEADAAFLAQHPNMRVVVEGHCNDRGSEEYNLALGENRAQALRQSLIAHGVSPDRIKIISYGKEQPFCKENDEACWQQNRRDHFSLQH